MNITCKPGVCWEDLKEVNANLFVLLTHYILFCNLHDLPCTITSIKSDTIKGVRVSSSHRDGRALDVSTKNWPEHLISSFVANTNIQYKDIAAISARDLQPRAAVYHDIGLGPHIHLQCRP